MDFREIIGTSESELSQALELMESELQEGQGARITLCTEYLPTREELDYLYGNMIAAGNHVSYPVADIVQGIPTTQFVVTKGSPVLPLLVPLLVPVLILGLITFGVAKIESISSALMPILLVVAGTALVLAVISRGPATKYIERGGKIPYLPSTVPATREYVTIMTPGATDMKPYEVISYETFRKENDRVRKLGLRPATGQVKRGNKWEWVSENQPAIATAEPISSEYGDLVGFIDEPFLMALLPAVDLEEGEKKIDVVMRQLKNGVEGIQQSDTFRTFLTTMAKFHDYSIGNMILIMIQKKDATRVAGFNTWKDLGRWVKKGERGIAILAPVMPPKQKPDDKAQDEAETETEIERRPVFFRVVYVFDVSQTEGKELPAFDVPVLTGDANEELFLQAMELLKKQRVDVSFAPMPGQDPSVKGYYMGKTIWVRPGESRAQQLKTLLHEMAHYYSEGVFRIPRADAETIAESAAFVVGAHYGFDTGTRSFPYVAIWSREKKVLQANLASIKRVAATILAGLGSDEKHLVADTMAIGNFPQRDAALMSLAPCEIIYTHDDGDVTIRAQNKLFVVTTDGKVFEEKLVADSKEYLAYTIDDIGYREPLDRAFSQAIERAKGK